VQSEPRIPMTHSVGGWITSSAYCVSIHHGLPFLPDDAVGLSEVRVSFEQMPEQAAAEGLAYNALVGAGPQHIVVHSGSGSCLRH
jgi:hypothetical protein